MIGGDIVITHIAYLPPQTYCGSSTPFFTNVVLPPGTPTMQELLCFSDQKINIAVEVGAKYSTFGVFLLDDKNGTLVEALEVEHSKNAERINMAILQKWLQGKGLKPVAWSTLVIALEKINL